MGAKNQRIAFICKATGRNNQELKATVMWDGVRKLESLNFTFFLKTTIVLNGWSYDSLALDDPRVDQLAPGQRLIAHDPELLRNTYKKDMELGLTFPRKRSRPPARSDVPDDLEGSLH